MTAAMTAASGTDAPALALFIGPPYCHQRLQPSVAQANDLSYVDIDKIFAEGGSHRLPLSWVGRAERTNVPLRPREQFSQYLSGAIGELSTCHFWSGAEVGLFPADRHDQ
jgi:hypothetical protein